MKVQIAALDHANGRMGFTGIYLTPEKGEKGKPHYLLDGATGKPVNFLQDRNALNRAMYAMKEPDKWLKTVK